MGSAALRDLVGERTAAAVKAGDVGPWYGEDGAVLGYGMLVNLTDPARIATDDARAAGLPGAYSDVTEVVIFMDPGLDEVLNISVVEGTLDPTAAANLEPVRPGAPPE